MTVIAYPTGVIVQSAAITRSDGWLLCDGTTYDGTDARYSALFALIGTTFGGTGTSFKVPDFGGRVAVGNGTSTAALGGWGGTRLVMITSTTAGAPAHSHTLTDPGHTHTPNVTGNHSHTQGWTTQSSFFKSGGRTVASANGASAFTTRGLTGGITLNSSGLSGFSYGTAPVVTSGLSSMALTPHTNVQPTLYLDFVIKL
jgi:microcystin-dependent protein